MDVKLFDALTRTLAVPRGRREAIKAGAAARLLQTTHIGPVPETRKRGRRLLFLVRD